MTALTGAGTTGNAPTTAARHHAQSFLFDASAVCFSQCSKIKKAVPDICAHIHDISEPGFGQYSQKELIFNNLAQQKSAPVHVLRAIILFIFRGLYKQIHGGGMRVCDGDKRVYGAGNACSRWDVYKCYGPTFVVPTR